MKILIADPHPEVQSALHLIVSRIPNVTVVNEVGSLVQLLAQCAQTLPDLILLDLNLVPPSRAQPQMLTDLISVLHHLCPWCKIVIMSSRSEVEEEALTAGASGFLSKTDPPDGVISGITRFFRNQS